MRSARLKRELIKRAIGYPVALAIVGAVLWRVTVWMPGEAPVGPLPPLTGPEAASAARLREDVDSLAGPYAGRAFGTDVLDAAGSFVARRLTEAGHVVAEQSYRAAGHTVRNLEVTIPGTVHPDSIVLLGAHYDVVVGTPGADDNASGTAALLELARLLAGSSPARTIRLVAFTLEEPPYFWSDSMGSVVYAQAARARGDAITAMLSLEAIGYYSDAPGSQRYPPVLGWFYPSVGNFVAVVGNIRSRALVHTVVRDLRSHLAVPTTGAATLNAFPGVGWSDHWSFWQEGYPAVMVTATATFRNPHYHDEGDGPAVVDVERLARVVHGLHRTVRMLGAR